MLLNELPWLEGRMLYKRIAWLKRICVTHENDGHYTIDEYGPDLNAESKQEWSGLDEFTAQAVLIHLTQGGNDETPG